MKSNVTRTVLEAVLITSLLLSVWFFIRYFNQSQAARSYVVQVQQAAQQAAYRSQYNNRTLSMLAQDCQEYAKTHPDMNRLLESFKNPPPAQPATPAAPLPAAKPPGK